MPTYQIKEEEIQELKDSLKRCPAGTFEAALKFRETEDPDQVPIVVMGIIERYLEPEMRPKLQQGDDTLLLIDDLGVDSLTMMEIVILVEETLRVSFDNQELRELRTIGDVKSFMDRKIRGGDEEAGENLQTVASEEILLSMPQQPPFLFLQSAKVGEDAAVGQYKVQGDEFFLRGHFKDNPVLPASILLEALGQLGVLYLLKSPKEGLEGNVRSESIYFTSCDGIRCHKIVKPGDTLLLRIKPKRLRHPLATFEGSISCKGEKVAFAEEITLTFDHAQTPLAHQNNPFPADRGMDEVGASESEKPTEAGVNGSHSPFHQNGRSSSH